MIIVADSNIAHLNDYFNAIQLGCTVEVIAMAGRDINAKILAKYQPDALLIRSVTQVNAELLADNDSVKFVGSATIGTDHVDQDYLAKRHIKFANAAGCSKHSVAQYVLTAILRLRPNYWNSNVTLGIIGLGNIGSTLATYAQDLGWHVLGYDPLLEPSKINNASFDAVLENSDVISLHVPLTTSGISQYPTHHLINEQAFAKMPANTMLINSARGQVVSESSLLRDLAKDSRQVVLDVFEYEPQVSAQLLDELAIATPHIAGYTLEGKLRGTQMIFDAFIKIFGLTVATEQLMDKLLPDNPYQWQDLRLKPEKLIDFYDIKADDKLLRQAVESNADNELKAVSGPAFDALRKNYPLRREWVS